MCLIDAGLPSKHPVPYLLTIFASKCIWRYATTRAAKLSINRASSILINKVVSYLNGYMGV